MAKTCQHCGNELEDTAKFCSHCGNKCENGEAAEKIYSHTCRKCGKELEKDTRFCPYCGTNQTESPNENIEGYINKGIQNAASKIDQMTGGNGEVKIHVKELFSGIFTKHSQEEKEELFIGGTKKTTPDEKDMITEWPSPWLYSRVFLMLLVVFVGLYFMISYFLNPNAIPGAMFIGSMAVPFSVLVFFWEMNIPRNISIFDVVAIFFIGGVLSLVCTLFIRRFQIFEEAGVTTYYGAMLIGVAEEIGKVIVVGYYIKKRNCKYILNGLLLGACVGAGFAVFETAGYSFRYFLSTIQYGYAYAYKAMLDILISRGKFAIGGHVVWAAISGAGLVVAKGAERLKTEHLTNPKFLKFLIIVIILHGIWDMPIQIGDFRYWCLTAIALFIVLILLHSGVKQVTHIVEKKKDSAENVL